MAKKPRDKANKASEIVSPVAPVAASEPVVETPVNPEVVSVNPEPVVVLSEVVEPTPEDSSDQPSTPVA